MNQSEKMWNEIEKAAARYGRAIIEYEWKDSEDGVSQWVVWIQEPSNA